MGDVVKLLSPFMNENMKSDLIYYLKHDNEMYFKGMVACAVCATISLIIMMAVGVLFILNGVLLGGVLCIFLSWAPLNAFSNIKMYLHVRKDDLEILEKLDKWLLRGCADD